MGMTVDAVLTDAQLRGATRTNAQLFRVTLTGVRLDGTNLTTVRSLTQQQVDSAWGDNRTKLPAGLKPPAHWSAGPAAPPAADP